LCAPPGAARDCQAIQSAMGDLSNLESPSWTEVLKAAQAGALPAPLTVGPEDSAALAGLLEDLLKSEWRAQIQHAARQALQDHPAASMLDIASDSGLTLRSRDDDDAATAPEDAAVLRGQAPTLAMPHLEAALTALNTPFSLQGVVNRVERDAQGRLRLSVRTQAAPPHPMQTFGPFLFLLLALVLLAFHVPGLRKTRAQRAARETAVAEYAKRPLF
jgi:hypothetical protein